MNGLLFLLYCIEILGALFCGAQSIQGLTTADLLSSTFDSSTSPASQTPSPADPTSVPSSASETTTLRSLTTASPLPGPQPSTTTTTTTPIVFYKKECLPVFMVAGGLIIACTILLLSALLLMWKVCQLSRRVKMLSNNADLISNCEYWMGTAKRNKNASETEAKETTVLMTDIGQTQEEMGNGTTKEDGGKVNKDGPAGEEKEVEDAAKNDEASSVTVAENPQEEAADSQSTKAVAASTANTTEEPKDVV